MADKKTPNPTLITIPNGPGQEFRVQLNSLNAHIAVSATVTLVQKAGKADERSFPANPNDTEFIQIHEPVGTPEALAAAVSKHPILSSLLDDLTEKIKAKYS